MYQRMNPYVESDVESVMHCFIKRAIMGMNKFTFP